MFTGMQKKSWEDLKQDIQQDTLSVAERLDKLFQFGLNALKLELGIISHIKKDTYTIEYSSNPDFVGQEFKLGDTYCSITVRHNRILGIRQMSISEYLRHPAYELFKLESYIGVPIMIDDKLYGTINFTMAQTRKDSFTDEEKTLLGEMGESVAELLKAQNS